MFVQHFETFLLVRARAHISIACRTLLLAWARAQGAIAIPAQERVDAQHVLYVKNSNKNSIHFKPPEL